MPRPIIISSGDLHNVGDLALLLQCAYGVREVMPGRPVLVRQWGAPPADVLDQLGEHDIGLLPGKDLPGAASAARGALVMIGGGQMVRDNASSASLGALAAMMEIARITGGEAAIVGCGVDRLKRQPHRWLWSRMMRGAALVTTRDAASHAEAEALCGSGGRQPVLTADIVFTPSPFAEALRRSDAGSPTVVVAPCADASEGREIDAGLVADAAIRLADQLQVNSVTLASHDARAGMDPDVCARIAAAIRDKAPTLGVDFVASYRLSDYTRLYASAAAVITNRLHSIIFALLAGKAIVVLDDGTAKTLAAAKRFEIPVSSATHAMDQAILDGLSAEVRSGAASGRRDAIDKASEAARSNFERLSVVNKQHFSRP